MNQPVDKRGVREMFDGIAPHYDFLNHFLTFGIDILWRKQAVARITEKNRRKVIVDVATGTGDLAFELIKGCQPNQLIGLDLSEGMLQYARYKCQQKGLESTATFVQANCEATGLEANSSDLVTVGFGIRNFQHPEKGLQEFHRILNAGGQLMILEFSQVENPLLRNLFQFYFNSILPRIGRLISKHPQAYTYLPESVGQFPYGKAFCQMIEKAGFTQVGCKKLTFGIATLYWGVKG